MTATQTTGLPTIAPYPMPSATDLPGNRVSWTPCRSRAVLLVHDMQNYFLRAFTTDASPVVELIDHIGRLTAACRRLGIPVVYSAQPGGQNPQQRGLQLDMWGRGISEDPHDAAIVAPIAPRPGDTLLTKWRYTAFHRTGLHELLTAAGRDQLIVTGIYAHIGCLMTATDAFMRDIQPFVVADAVADFSRADHDMALRYAAGRAAVVTTTDTMLSTMEGTP
ncbi:MAG: isochorismatase family protein [Actinophytocola sp.]|uniref:isochorismatase family protein n=1 Tax=Actinophytocola sp. TaxID=1872138 RepID=UPI003C71618D